MFYITNFTSENSLDFQYLITEEGLDKQKTQASNLFGKEGGLEFFVYKGKMSSYFQR